MDINGELPGKGKDELHILLVYSNGDHLEGGMQNQLKSELSIWLQSLQEKPISEQVSEINEVRELIHNQSPFKAQPVDFVKWVPSSDVTANDYNPNSVAPPEMELLRTSIRADGYTQPIVGNQESDKIVVVDGFHRHRVGKECEDINALINDFLPVVQIRSEQVDRNHRMASTVRHNRARGKHRVEAMSDMVIELKRRNWSDSKICKELGMDQDEVLRLCQISGLSDIFSGQEFSKAWEPQGHITPEDFEDLSGVASDYSEEEIEVRTANTDDENRIFHTFDKWECAAAGFYETKPPAGMTADNCRAYYRDLLTNIPEFERVLAEVTSEWKHSCEHYLTNSAMNRVAWLGQAALCKKYGIPSEFRGGYGLLTEAQQLAADEAALRALNSWLETNGMQTVEMADANPNRQSDIY
jgi:ParB-like chromosome segregation protein Spo0J